MEEASKSENINYLVCLICREEEPEFLTWCKHNFHKDCLKNWHDRVKNECPYCRSFITLNGKLNLFLENIENNDDEIDICFDEEDIQEVVTYLKCSNANERVFHYLIPTIKSELTKGRLLQLFSAKGYFDAVRLLLENGALVEAKDKGDRTSLILASQNGHLEIVKLLLDRGALVEEVKDDRWKSLIEASYYGYRGALLELKDDKGWTSLFAASAKEHLEIVKLLLDRGAFIEAKEITGWTSLMIASRYGYFEIVKLLLDRGANVKAKGKSGWTSLMIASRYGHFEIVKLLLVRGANVKVKGKSGRASLRLASDYRHMRIVELLMDHGASELGVAENRND